MTSMPYRSASLDRIIAPWVANIAGLFAIIVEIILTMVERAGKSSREPGAFCRKAGWPGLPRPMILMMQMIQEHETKGRHVRSPGARPRILAQGSWPASCRLASMMPQETEATGATAISSGPRPDIPAMEKGRRFQRKA